MDISNQNAERAKPTIDDKPVIKNKGGRRRKYFTVEEKQEVNRRNALNSYYRKKGKVNPHNILNDTLTKEEQDLLAIYLKKLNLEIKQSQ